ncbi:hypothetical protein AAHH67_09705 [Niallia circulans]
MLENATKTKDEYLTIQRNLKNESGIISTEKAAKYVSDSKKPLIKLSQMLISKLMMRYLQYNTNAMLQVVSLKKLLTN